MTGNRSELLPCPFCGGTELYDDDQRVQCNDCFAESPVTAWNTRAPNQPLSDDVVERVLDAIALYKDEAETAIFQAIGDIKIGNPTDDKLILANLAKQGVTLCRLSKARAAIAAIPSAGGVETEERLGALSGSREPNPSCTGSGPTGFDPAREQALREALEPFIAAAEMGVLTYEAVRAANLCQQGLSDYETVYVGAGSHAADSRISYADWRRMAKLRDLFPLPEPPESAGQ